MKPGTAITGPGGKQIILQNKGPGSSQSPQIVTLVKTSQGMQVGSFLVESYSSFYISGIRLVLKFRVVPRSQKGMDDLYF